MMNPEGDLFRGGVPAITPGIVSDLRKLTQRMADQVKGDAALIESVGTGWCAHPTRFGSEHASVLRSIQAGATLGEMKGAQPYAEKILRELGGQLVIDCWSLPRPA